MDHLHLIVRVVCMAAGWLVFVSGLPRAVLFFFKRAVLGKGFGEGPIPINTVAVEPQALFADPLHPPKSASTLATRGVNRDTLPVVGVLDLRSGPRILHVPDMAGRYYSVQLTDPSNNTVFAYVGTRATGSSAGRYVIVGPRWKGAVPDGVRRISSPNDSIFVLGRVFVANDGDLSAAHALAREIRVTGAGEDKGRQKEA